MREVTKALEAPAEREPRASQLSAKTPGRKGRATRGRTPA
jgi:hypothetical protein